MMCLAYLLKLAFNERDVLLETRCVILPGNLLLLTFGLVGQVALVQLLLETRNLLLLGMQLSVELLDQLDRYNQTVIR